jgi:hypothetical protein
VDQTVDVPGGPGPAERSNRKRKNRPSPRASVVEAVITGVLAAIGLALVVVTLTGSPAPARASGLPSQVSTSTVPRITRPTSTTTPTTVPRTTPRTTAPRSTATTTHSVTTTYRSYSGGYTATTYATGGRTATTPPSTAATTTSTIAPLAGGPVAPATLPLVTRGSNAHVSPVFPILSGAGFALALLIAGGRFFMTRSGGADRRPMPRPES